MARDWFWQLQAAGQGPDWRFSASFAPADAARLAAHVRYHALPGFAHYRVDDGFCARHGHRSSYDMYIDEGNYAQLVANFAGDQAQNVWIYHTIEVCGHDLTIERGYGGYPGSHGLTETALITTLAQATDLTLLDWAISYRGEGYAAEHVASGTSAAELLTYLAGG